MCDTPQQAFTATVKEVAIMNTATLRAVGGSVSVNLPRQMLRGLGLEAGSSVTVTVESGRLVLSPTRPRHTLEDLLAGMKPGDMPTDKGWDEAPPLGREAW
jgi:antitoxin component of MazEF toxin-antitoxin module